MDKKINKSKDKSNNKNKDKNINNKSKNNVKSSLNENKKVNKEINSNTNKETDNKIEDVSNSKITNNANDNNNNETSLKKRNKPMMKKAFTTYRGVNNVNRKYNNKEFQKQLDNFNAWEEKRKRKLEKLKEQKEEDELKLLRDPKVNTEVNVKYNNNLNNYTLVERLYTQDLKKRHDKKEILKKIYTPSFKPTLYTNKEKFNKISQKSRNDRTPNAQRFYTNDYINENEVSFDEKKKNKYESSDDEDEDEDEEDSSDEKNENLRMVNKNKKEMKKTITEGRLDEKRVMMGDKNKIRVKINNKGMKKNTTQNKFDGNKNRTRNKKVMKKTLTDDRFDEKKTNRKKEKNNGKEKEFNFNNVEIKLRNLLFKNKRPIGGKRNNSVQRRKKVAFTLD